MINKLLHSIIIFFIVQMPVVHSVAQSMADNAQPLDSTITSLPNDSTNNDSVIVIRKQAVVHKQVQLTYQTIVDTVFKHHLSVLVDIPQMPAGSTTLNYQSTQTTWSINQSKRYNIRLLYHRYIHHNLMLGAGLNVSKLSYQLHYLNQRSHINIISSTKIDTVEVYYIEENGVPRPHYITRSNTQTHTDTIVNTRRCDTLTQIYHLGLPIDLRWHLFSNLFTIISLHTTIEPGILLSTSGAVAQTDSLVTLNTRTARTPQLNAELGFVASLLVTEQLSFDLSAGYRHSFTPATTILPTTFWQHQSYCRIGVSYCF